ncbi:hypothetical protein, partial [Pseudomonas sp. AH2 (2023)]|uniref:hypothetical protein n=1 Tax=Pseudomonas sp. AH2 (2023) TaxID=3048599 RepID=UPI002B239D90
PRSAADFRQAVGEEQGKRLIGKLINPEIVVSCLVRIILCGWVLPDHGLAFHCGEKVWQKRRALRHPISARDSRSRVFPMAAR